MKPQYSHKLMTSFALWMDNYLLTKGEAYKNISGHSLTYNADPQLPDKIIFSSAYKQWVYDSSVPGATVKNYISGAGYPTLSRQGQPDLKIDYDNLYSKSEKQLWLDELDIFVDKYEDWIKEKAKSKKQK